MSDLEIVATDSAMIPAQEAQSEQMGLIERLVTVLKCIALAQQEYREGDHFAAELQEMARSALGIDLHSQGLSDPAIRDAFFRRWGISPPPALTNNQQTIIRKELNQ